MAQTKWFELVAKFHNLTSNSVFSTGWTRPISTLRRQSYNNSRRNLLSIISPLGNPSLSMDPVLDNWIVEGNKVNELELRTIIRDLRSRRRYNHALEISEWMKRKESCRFSPGDHAVQLNLLARVHGLQCAENYFSKLSDRDKTHHIYGALLNCYVREGLVDKSLSLMQKMKDLGFASALCYHNIMCLYSKNSQFEEVPALFSKMKEDGFTPDIFSYRIYLNSYGALSDFENMEKLLKEMEAQDHVSPDWLTYSSVANLYIRAGRTDKALIYLKKCEEKINKDAMGYNHLISLYTSLGNTNAVLRLWKLQKANCKKQLNRDYITTVGCLVKLGEFSEAEKLLEEWESSGNCYDFRVPNILLIGYCQKGLVEKAETMLLNLVGKGKIPIPNSWSIIASGYLDNQQMEKAFECFKEALAVRNQNQGWRPKPTIISSLLDWLSDSRGVDDVEDFINSLKTVISVNRDMYQALIKAYSRCGKEVDTVLVKMREDGIEDDEEIKRILAQYNTHV